MRDYFGYICNCGRCNHCVRAVPPIIGFRPMTDNELLTAAIEASGMSKMAFARNVLVREYRTIRRWASGQSPMPKAVRVYLEEYLRKHRGKRNVVLPSPNE